ncbi:hypothetical protein BLD48_05930 [Exiguobacterium sp. KRL4]|uniref:hypothetical protein n=1 Tax=Exiguobacterium sp. KRL4 TaxID=1914536 RepID=UPI0008F92A34|nr:hypothetical protein [Exiguobacterium sp. KRL4]OIN67425.1 hypothetical protein BLD48_05930 [Exiguobacterium sp. KRL4]
MMWRIQHFLLTLQWRLIGHRYKDIVELRLHHYQLLVDASIRTSAKYYYAMWVAETEDEREQAFEEARQLQIIEDERAAELRAIEVTLPKCFFVY